MSKFILCALAALPLLAYCDPNGEEISTIRNQLKEERETLIGLKEEFERERQVKLMSLDELNEIKKLQDDQISALLEELMLAEDDSLSDFDDDDRPDKERYRPDPDLPAIYIRGDFLYWKTLESDLDFAVQNQPVTSATTGAIGKYEMGSFSFDPGFRLAAGLRLPPDNWEMELAWLRFNNKGAQTINAPIASSSYALVGTFHQTTSARLQVAKSHLDLKINAADLSLGKRFFPWDTLLVKFYTALSGAWLDQDWRIDYLSSVNNDFIHQHWNFKGAGLKGGLSLDWLLGWGFGLLTRFGAAGFVGPYKNDFKYTEQTSTDNFNTFGDSHYKDTRFVFNLHYFLGLNWGWTFSNDWNLDFSLGYEIQPWFNLQEVNRTDFTTSYNGRESHLSQGLLTTHGVTFSAELNF